MRLKDMRKNVSGRYGSCCGRAHEVRVWPMVYVALFDGQGNPVTSFPTQEQAQAAFEGRNG